MSKATKKIKSTQNGNAGITASVIAAASALSKNADAQTPVKVVLLTGAAAKEYNGIGRELYIRHIFEGTQDWVITAVRANDSFTPELISDAGLFIVCRDASPDAVSLFGSDNAVSDTVQPGVSFWSDENTDAIIDRVENGGMGLIALERTIFCGNRRFLDFLDVEALKPHNMEPVWYTRMNHEHPITGGVGKFSVMVDEQPLVVIKSSATETLFESTAVHEKRQGVSGWALERGKGRVAGLLPGGTMMAYETPEYQNIIWRAAHWAMGQDIPSYATAENRYY